MIYYCANNKNRFLLAIFDLAVDVFLFSSFHCRKTEKKTKRRREISLSAFIGEEGFENYESK